MGCDWKDVWAALKDGEVACCLFELSAAKLVKAGELKCESDGAGAVVFQRAMHKLGVWSVAASVQFLTDFVIIVNQKKYDPTSCSNIISQKQSTEIYSYRIYQFSLLYRIIFHFNSLSAKKKKPLHNSF